MSKNTDNIGGENEYYLASFLDRLPGMAYRCLNDRNWTMKYVSGGCQQLLGYRPEDLIDNQKIAYNDLIVRRDRHHVWKEVQKAIKAGRRFRIEYGVRTISGEEKYVWEQGRGIADENNNLLIEGFITDVTERISAFRKKDELINSLSFLSRSALRYLTKTQGDDIYAVIAEQLYDFIGDCYVVVNSFDEQHNRLKLERIEGPRRGLNFILKQLGSKSGEFTFPLTDEESRAGLLRGQLMENPLDLCTATFGKISQSVCKAIEKRLGAMNAYCMGIVLKGHLYGNVSILVSRESDLENPETIETFVRQAATVLARQRAEEQARLQEEKYRLLVENIKDGVVISQKDRFIFFNQQFAEMLGYSYDELLMKDYRDVYTERGLAILMDRFHRREKGESVPSQYETIFKKKDGSDIDVEANVTIIDYKNDKATFAVIRDISRRKRIEAEILRQKQYFEALFRCAANAIVSLDMEQHIIAINPQFEKLFGWSSAEIKGKNIDSLITPEEYRLEAAKVAELVQQGGIAIKESKRQRKDGSLVVVSIGGAPIVVDGKMVGILVIYRDITEQKAAEAERERMIRELQAALNKVKTLSGLIPICANCKRIRDDKGYWNDVEMYISQHSDAEFSHGLCNECMQKLYPDQYRQLQEKRDRK